MEKEEIIKQMAKKIVEAMDPEKAKEVLMAVIDGRDIYKEILGTGGTQGPQAPRKRRARRKKNVAVEAPSQEA